ncbi:MAG: hypothetical protein ABIF19_10705 [Planctomycetota bacterium]
MQNKNHLWLAVGGGLAALVVVAFVLTKQAADRTEISQNGELATSAAGENAVYGSVELPETIARFAAEGDKGLVTIAPKNGTGQLPVGKYRIRLWRTERKDDQGNTWALSGQYFGNEGTFEVSESGATRLDLGEPVICTPQATKGGSVYYFNYALRGRLDEYIEATRNGSRPQAPKLRIKNKDGTYDRTFNFEYG